MLQKTFVHISGIGPKTEQQLWQTGVQSWEQFSPPATSVISTAKSCLISNHLAQQPKDILHEPSYFYDTLPSREQWRLFRHFRHSTAYLDIETTGQARDCQITTVSLYDGDEIFTFVNGENLEELPHHLAAFDVLVTYNGKSFDVPVMERFFNISLPQAHLDLRPLLASVGYKGGLKGCEKQLGISRHNLEGLDGYSAVLLWAAYKRTGQRPYLDTLLAYNIADTINLEPLIVQAYNLHLQETPFQQELHIPLPIIPQIPIQADLEVIREIKATLQR